MDNSCKNGRVHFFSLENTNTNTILTNVCNPVPFCCGDSCFGLSAALVRLDSLVVGRINGNVDIPFIWTPLLSPLLTPLTVTPLPLLTTREGDK